MTKTTTKPQKNVGIIVGTLWVWDMDWAILCPIQFWKYAKKIVQNIGSQSICRIDFAIGIFQSKP